MFITCSSCGARTRIDENDVDYEPWMPQHCSECGRAEVADEARYLISKGKPDEAAELLAEHVSYPPGVAQDGMVAALMYEAADYLRRGDESEAAYRLRLAAEPKWDSINDCKEQYEAAMVETRRAREACV